MMDSLLSVELSARDWQELLAVMDKLYDKGERELGGFIFKIADQLLPGARGLHDSGGV